jgi:CRISPR associated protein Cas1/Type III restriction enzyme, res subunit
MSASLRPLRPHQVRALEALRGSLAAGNRRPMLQAPTGFGKTLTAAHIIQRALDKGKRVAFVVPALSLIDQTVAAFEAEGNRNAAHPVNAILNYAYAALESETRIKAISDGYEPTIGIMHEGSDGSSKFVFDLMEPERPKVDRAVLDFVKGHVFDPADFVIRIDGVCRLNPEMARMIVAKISAS